MVTIKVKELYPYTQISQRNNKAWKLVHDKVKEYTDSEIEVDTEGLLIENPTGNMDFRKLMGDTRVTLVLHNSTELESLIKIYLMSCGYDESRVRNEGIIEQVVIEKKGYRENLVTDFMTMFEKEGADLYIDISKRVTQVGSESTLESIIEAIKRKVKEVNDGVSNAGSEDSVGDIIKVNRVIIDFNNMHIQEHILSALHTMLKELAQSITVTVVNLPDAKAFNDIKNEDEGFNSSIPLKERWQLFKEYIPKGTVGFLCMFKKTRRVDRLGRHGDGKPIWSRFAVFRGIRKDDKKIRLVFDVYRTSEFFTKAHQELEFEEENPSLTPIRVEMGLNQIGILDKFTGTDYHFNYPIQYRSSDSIHMRTIQRFGNEYGTVFGPVRLPEVAKYVLDDFGVKYNEEKLEYAIKETNRILIGSSSIYDKNKDE